MTSFDETRITKTYKMNIENLIVGNKYLLTDQNSNIIEVTYLGIDNFRSGERIKLLKKGKSIHSIYYLNDIKSIELITDSK